MIRVGSFKSLESLQDKSRLSGAPFELEALSNAMLYGNRLQARKLVRVRCCCDCCKGVCIVISDQGEGFDPEMVPDPLAVENLESEHGRGIHLMKLAMDEVSFEHGGTEVRMRKKLGLEQRKCASALLCRDGVR